MRYPRIDFPAARHHIMNRGSRREVVFPDDEARQLFLELLAPLGERFGVDVHAYALMPNHYHLLVTSRLGRVDRAMRYLGAEFTRRTNARLGWDGSLFRGRYKNRVVEVEDHWRYLLLYLHANPVRAGLSTRERAPWTSHGAYVGAEAAPTWLAMEPLLQCHQGTRGYAAAWAAHVDGKLAVPAGFAPDQLWHYQHSAGTAPKGLGDGGHVVAEVLDRVAAITQVARASLTGPTGRGARVPERWFAAWWLSRKAGVEHKRICAAFGVGHDAVSRDIRRFELRQGDDPRLAGWVAAMQAWGAGEGVKA